MPYCRECGSYMEEGDTYCKNCGQDVLVLTKEEFEEMKDWKEEDEGNGIITYGPTDNSQYINQESVINTDEFGSRNFWLWLLVSFTWFGLTVYYWINIGDLRSVSMLDKPVEGPSLQPPQIFIFLTGVSYVLIPFSLITHPIFNYYKFQGFYDYLQYSTLKQETIPKKGKDIAIVNGLFNVFLVTMIVLFATEIWLGGIICLPIVLGLGCLFIYWSYIWQKAMNERSSLLKVAKK